MSARSIPEGTFPLAAALLLVTLPAVRSPAGERTWAERLGYPSGKRVLLLHADDVGMCFEANDAAKRLLEAGAIQSAAAMVPCPWFDEFAAWYRDHPQFDVGLHLTLTSEWRYYRWGPVTPRAEVPGLLDSDGYLHRSVEAVVRRASPAEVEREIRAQVDRALSRGIRPSHLDTHMGTLYGHPAFTRVYLKVAREYGIPAMVIEPTEEIIARFRAQGYVFADRLPGLLEGYDFPRLDDFRSVPAAETYEEKLEKFFALVRGLKPGITEIIFHPASESDALRRITNSWQQRVWEARMFLDPRVREFLASEKVLFTNWKEMLKRWKERRGAGPERRRF